MTGAERLARAVVYATAAVAVAAPAAWAWARPEIGPWLLVGAGFWLAAVVAKISLSGAVVAALPGLAPIALASLLGLLSAATELGLLALYLAGHVPGGAAAALALGVGAGGLEALMLGMLAARQPAADPAGPAPRAVDALAFPVERLAVALPGHVGSRALVAATAMGLGWWWAAIAVATFTFVDAVPTYADRAGWAWSDPRTLWGYYGVAGVVGWLEVALALAALR